MVVAKLFSQLHRRPRSLSFLSPHPLTRHLRRTTPPSPFHPPPSFVLSNILSLSSSLHHSRSLSSTTQGSDRCGLNLSPESQPRIGSDGSGVVGGEDGYPFPFRTVVSLLDGCHDFTGLPWWIVIASSTLALRLVLFPVLVLQIKKLSKIKELFPKLPPASPPPLSGRSYTDQIFLHLKEQKALGCPSYLWPLAYFSVQAPCFFLWMVSIQKMSLYHHPGFECGGALWFQNLTKLPYGLSGAIFPLLVGGLHYTNVQLSFRTKAIGNATGLLHMLLKYYKYYLDLFTIPIILFGLCVPQGSLVYWVTNATLTVVQQLSLKNAVIRKRLGLLENEHPVEIGRPNGTESVGTTSLTTLNSLAEISLQNLSHQELLALSVKLLAEGQNDRAISLLELALDKDPEYIRALVLMGYTLLQNGSLAEASEYLERAISKLSLTYHPLEVEKVDLLILASQWASISCVKQGRSAEGIMHLERLANLEEPDDPVSKAHYFDGLLLLGSALYDEGRKAEAAEYLRMVVSYNPAYTDFLKLCEQGEDTFVSDLARSRRGDY